MVYLIVVILKSMLKIIDNKTEIKSATKCKTLFIYIAKSTEI